RGRQARLRGPKACPPCRHSVAGSGQRIAGLAGEAWQNMVERASPAGESVKKSRKGNTDVEEWSVRNCIGFGVRPRRCDRGHSGARRRCPYRGQLFLECEG